MNPSKHTIAQRAAHADWLREKVERQAAQLREQNKGIRRLHKTLIQCRSAYATEAARAIAAEDALRKVDTYLRDGETLLAAAVVEDVLRPRFVQSEGGL